MNAFSRVSLLIAIAAMPVVVQAQSADPGPAPAPAPAVNPNADTTATKTANGILFKAIAPANTTIYLAGDFNNWADNQQSQITDAKYKFDGPDASGMYTRTEQLSVGAHKFKVVTNGSWAAPDWAKERDADDNAIIYISGAGDVLVKNPVSNDWRPNYKDGKTTFYLYYPTAKSVYIAGDFNTWGNNKNGVVSDASAAMQGPDANGVWTITVPMSVGTHAYKFAINGTTWETDPNADKLDSGSNSVFEAK